MSAMPLFWKYWGQRDNILVERNDIRGVLYRLE